MRKLLCILILMFGFTAVYSQTTLKSEVNIIDQLNGNMPQSLVIPENQWNVQYFDQINGNEQTIRYSFSQDSALIDGSYYHELFSTDEQFGNNWDSIGLYFREDEQKIWQYTDTGDYLLYDFTLEVNDTFYSPGFHREDARLIVRSVDSIVMLDGTQRKRISLRCHDDPDGTLYGERVWVEGIGDLNGLLSIDQSCLVDLGSSLFCYYFEDNILYQNTTQGECWITAISNQSNDTTVLIYPNPTNDFVVVETSKRIKSIALYDIRGKELVRLEKANKINVSHLKSGPYLMKVSFFDGAIAVKKIVIK